VKDVAFAIKSTDLAIFAGSANPVLARLVAESLGTTLGRRTLSRFPDGELHVEVQETVRGRDVFLIQSTNQPVDERVMELLFLGDACRRAGAERIIAVIPYFGYARQDRRASGREPVGARVIADLLGAGGFDRVVAVDLHTTALEGVFGVPLDHLSATALLANAISDTLPGRSVIVSPDLGGVKLAERYARILRLPLAIVHKQRISGEKVEAHGVIGTVRSLSPIIVDDMISTAGTVEAALKAVIAEGATPEATVVATHALLVGPALERLAPLPIKRLVVTDSVEPQPHPPAPVRIVNLASLLAETITRLHLGESLGDLLAHA
jgi:ribose-phosphate pyrophosphokinase